MHNKEKDVWQLQQFYYQSQLDTIHYHLVHTKWELYIQRFSNQHDEQKHDVQETNFQNKGKYVTDLSTSDDSNYKFGIDHSHPYLSPVYSSVHDELLCNNLSTLSSMQFTNLVVKSIKLHNIATGPQYKDELICKHFSKEYNILRNEKIGLRHILSIIIYTDCTKYCTMFRTTYTKLNDGETEQEVTNRHKQLYYYSRSLFEAVEFFGNLMEPHLKVYHGLNKVMKFSMFTAYFNQPISTTISLTTAVQFADTNGIILTLQSGAEYFESSKIPKYLSVSWASSFPNEDEKLFYGENVVFRIVNITESVNLQGHSKELKMLNKFQSTLQNQKVTWNKKNTEDKQKINALVKLIKQQQNNELDNNDDDELDNDDDDEKKK
eukprot:312218_1